MLWGLKLRIVSLSKRYIGAMHINLKWGLFRFNMHWQYHICITTCTYVFTVVDTVICLKIWAKQCPRMQEIHFCLKCLTQKCCCLNSSMMFSWRKTVLKNVVSLMGLFLVLSGFSRLTQLLSWIEINNKVTEQWLSMGKSTPL